MTNLDDRKSAFENKFALDEALLFKAEARACKNFGLWLGEKLGQSEDEAKALAVFIIEANLEEPGFNDVRRAVAPIVADSGVNVSDDEMNDKLEALYLEAQEEIKAEG